MPVFRSIKGTTFLSALWYGTEKETTKISAVFDASCSVDGFSPNQRPYSGPNLLPKIFDILLRFRHSAIAILAGIKVAISPEHSDYLRLLWCNFSIHEQLIGIHRFLRVFFGVTSGPLLGNGAIRHHLLVLGCETPDQGKMLYTKSNAVMNDAGLQLRK